MKKNKQELDVDFIGGAAPLTKEEETAITEFLKSRKQSTAAKKSSKQNKVGKRSARRTNAHP